MSLFSDLEEIRYAVVLIWWSGESHNISAKVQDLLMDKNNSIFISFVSIWEIQFNVFGKVY